MPSEGMLAGSPNWGAFFLAPLWAASHRLWMWLVLLLLSIMLPAMLISVLSTWGPLAEADLTSPGTTAFMLTSYWLVAMIFALRANVLVRPVAGSDHDEDVDRRRQRVWAIAGILLFASWMCLRVGWSLAVYAYRLHNGWKYLRSPVPDMLAVTLPLLIVLAGWYLLSHVPRSRLARRVSS